ncbi:glycosyltransferase family 2 protein [Thermodesulfobacteriota bacterium]
MVSQISGDIEDRDSIGPTISVVVPYHNESETIRTTLELLATQTYLPREVILVDSASTDDSFEVVENWMVKNGPRFDGIRFENINTGTCVPSSSKNAGIRLARGEVVALMDCGLLFDVDWLEKQVEFMRSGAFEVVSGGCVLKGENWIDVAAVAQTYGYKKFNPCMPSSLVKRTVFEDIGLFLEGRRSAYDVDWANRLKTEAVRRGINENVIVRYNGVNYADTFQNLWRKTLIYAENTVGIHGYPYPYFYLLLILATATTAWVYPPAVAVLCLLYFAVRGIVVPLKKSENLAIFRERPSSFWTLPLIGLIIDLGKLAGYTKGFLKR